MRFIQKLNDFLNNFVNLNKTRLELLAERVKTITDLLRGNYPYYKKYSEQGSYAHKTIIKPVKDNDEFDADILIYINDSNFSLASFTDYIDQVYRVLKDNSTYKDKVKRKSRCVMIDYAGDFHLDIVPCIEHNGKYYICNRKEKKYEETDGEGYKEWLQEKNRIIGNNYFCKVVRLLKFLRDHKSNFSVKSILLTTLLGEQVDLFKSSDRFPDLPTTLKILSNRLNTFLQNNLSMPTINNPVLPMENFTRHWDEDKYRNFREKFNTYNMKINDAYDEKDLEESTKKWRELFGDEFGEGQSDKKGTKSAASIGVIYPTVPATKPYACALVNSIPQHEGVIHYQFAPMIKYTPEDLEAVQKCFPNFRLKYDTKSNSIRGALDIKARYVQEGKRKQWVVSHCECDDNDCIQDTYKVEICFSNRGLGIPEVFETEGRIKQLAEEMGKPYADLHLNRDGSCCLAFRTDTSITLEAFIRNRVYPYFVWQAYFAKYKKVPPSGEYSHDSTKAKAEFMNDIKHLGRNDPCWCGSGKKYKKCHLDRE